MLNYKEAQQIITAQARSFGQESVGLDDAFGRVLSEKIYADRDYPPFNRATMDGYAINFKDWAQGIRNYAVKEVVFAGQQYQQEVAAGECYKIMTGAAVPPFADLVIRREDATEENAQISFSVETVKPLQNIARRGEDIKNDVQAIDRNCICTPQVIALLASFGKTEFKVEKLPVVSIFTLRWSGFVIPSFELRIYNPFINPLFPFHLSTLPKWLLNTEWAMMASIL